MQCCCIVFLTCWSCATCISPCHDVQLLCCIKQSQDCDEVRGQPPCVCNNKPAAPQGYYHRQSSMNIHHAAPHSLSPSLSIIYNNSPLIKESSLSCCCAAQLCWNNQSVEAFVVWFFFCLSQHTTSFGWQHFNQDTFNSLPLTKCLRACSEIPLIVLIINEKVSLIYL